MIELGKKYRDIIHGTEGIATCLSKYLTGCDQVRLERLNNDGDIVEMWFDITQLEGVRVAPKDRKPGGPQSHAPAQHR